MDEQQLEQPVFEQPKPKKRRGKILALVALVVVLVAGTSYGVYVWQQKKVNDETRKVAGLQSQVSDLKTNNEELSKDLAAAKKTSSSSSTSATESTVVVNIKDLGLNVTVPSSLSDLTSQWVHLTGDQAVNSVVLSSTTAEAAGCARSTGALGILTYDEDKGGTYVASARASKLYYLPPTSNCSAVTSKNKSDLLTALKSLVSDGSN